MEADTVRIARGSAYLTIQSIVTIVASVIAFAFIARILTQTEMGIIVVLVLIVSATQVLSDLGFSSGLAKCIAEYRGRNVDYRPILFTGVVMKAMLAALAVFSVVMVSQQLSEVLAKSNEYAILFQLLSIDVLFACINVTLNSFLLGLNKIQEMAILNVVAIITRQMGGVILLIYGYGLTGLIIGWISGEFAFAVLSTSLLIRGKHLRVYPAREMAPCLKTLAKFSWPLFFTNLVMFFYNWFDRAVLLIYVPLGDVGVYSVAYAAFSVLYVIPTALSTTLFPYYSEQYGRNGQKNIAMAVRAASRYIALLFTPLALGLMATANPTITLFAGPMYANGDVILAILSLFGGVSGVSATFGALLLVFNMTSTILLINIASVGVSVAVSLLLLPSLGATGMAIIKGASMLISLVLTIVVLKKRIQIEFDMEAIWKSWVAAMIMFLAVGLVERMYFHSHLLPLYIFIGGVVYVAALRSLKVVRENDIQLFRNIVGKRATSLMNIIKSILT